MLFPLIASSLLSFLAIIPKACDLHIKYSLLPMLDETDPNGFRFVGDTNSTMFKADGNY